MFDAEVEYETNSIRDLLIAKNRQYGDAALNPLRVFSQAETTEQIRVRIDDKLSRVQAQDWGDTEDSVQDLIGYLILLRIAQRRERATDLHAETELVRERRGWVEVKREVLPDSSVEVEDSVSVDPEYDNYQHMGD